MRILVVNWQDRENPRAGGAEIHLHEVFGRLADRGHAVTLLCSGWPGAADRVELDGIQVHRVGTRYTLPLHARRYARRNFRPGGFDVVVEDLNKAPLFTPGWGLGPVVLLVHHLFGRTAFREATPPVAAATVLLEQTLPLRYRGLPTVAVSASTRDDLIRRGLRAQDIQVIPNGVDLTRFHPDPAVGEYTEPTLLYLGRLQRYKGVDLLLGAVAHLRDRGVAVRLLVAGKGPDRARLEGLVRSRGLADRVRFLGFVSDDEKVALMRRSWIHLLTSPREGWGITNLEAAACGTPTVASDAPGLRDSVQDGVTGFLVPHGDVPALAEKIRLVLQDPDLRARLGRAALAFARGFTWEASAVALESVLESARVRAPGRARP